MAADPEFDEFERHMARLEDPEFRRRVEEIAAVSREDRLKRLLLATALQLDCPVDAVPKRSLLPTKASQICYCPKSWRAWNWIRLRATKKLRRECSVLFAGT